MPAVSPKGRRLVRSTHISSTANRSGSSGAEVTKSVTTWSDAPNGQQCGLHDNGDNGVRNEFIAVQDASEMTCPVSRNIALAWLGIGLGFTSAHMSPILHSLDARTTFLAHVSDA